jgi:signal transduction histidine kinase
MPVRNVQFTVHPGIFQALGSQLVSEPLRALSELVKNAYDADASVAKIIFKDGRKRTISVVDDGHGMSLEEIGEGWLQLGTPLKRERIASEKKRRILSGSMGIGRLAAFSLADEVILETGRLRSEWHWARLSLPDILSARSFGDLVVQVRKISRPPAKSGTIVRLGALRWWPTGEELEKLRVRLSMISGPEEVKDFVVKVTYRGKSKELRLEEELPVAPLTVTGVVKGDGRPEFTIAATRNLYQGTESLPEGGWTFQSKRSFAHLAGVRLACRWYPRRDRPAGAYWSMPTNSDFLQDITGLRVYRDGIRVLPYGEPGNDWLNLEAKYVKAGAVMRHPRPSGLVGWVLISRRENPLLMDTANRDGLLQNEAFGELASFCDEAFDNLAVVRRRIEPIIREPRQLTESVLSQALGSLTKAKKALTESPDLQEELRKIEEVLHAVRDEFELLSLYRDRLTAGNLVRFVLHDVGAGMNVTRSLIDVAMEETCNRESHDKALTVVQDFVPRLIGAYELLRGAARAGAYRRATVDVSQTAHSIIEKFESISAISVSFRQELEPVKATIREADVWSILTNLIHNAITSAEFEQARDRSFPQHREIAVRVKSTGRDLVLECEDNGPGLPDKPTGWIWAPFNTTRKGGGSGLGLWIVSDIVTWYGGTKKATKSEIFDTGAKFEVRLPEVVETE